MVFEEYTNGLILGLIRYNGVLPQGERGRRRSKYALFKRSTANGIKKSRHYVVKQPQHEKVVYLYDAIDRTTVLILALYSFCRQFKTRSSTQSLTPCLEIKQ